MTRIQLELPDELLETARARAADAGFATVEAYASALFQEELSPADEDLERLLLERKNDPRPSTEDSPEFWDDIKKRLHVQTEAAPLTQR
jgi:hypothetical protein